MSLKGIIVHCPSCCPLQYVERLKLTCLPGLVFLFPMWLRRWIVCSSTMHHGCFMSQQWLIWLVLVRFSVPPHSEQAGNQQCAVKWPWLLLRMLGDFTSSLWRHSGLRVITEDVGTNGWWYSQHKTALRNKHYCNCFVEWLLFLRLLHNITDVSVVPSKLWSNICRSIFPNDEQTQVTTTVTSLFLKVNWFRSAASLILTKITVTSESI